MDKKPVFYQYCIECNIVYAGISLMPSLQKKCSHPTVKISEKQYIDWVLDDKKKIKNLDYNNYILDKK